MSQFLTHFWLKNRSSVLLNLPTRFPCYKHDHKSRDLLYSKKLVRQAFDRQSKESDFDQDPGSRQAKFKVNILSLI